MCEDTNHDGGTVVVTEKNGYTVERVFSGTRTAEQVVADLIKAHAGEGG